MLDMGFTNVVGRPSCTGGLKLLVDLVRLRQRPEVVVVADADGPGKQGAMNLSSVLRAYVPAVRIIEPHRGIKDMRVWAQAGATRQDVDQAIEAAEVLRGLVICARTKASRGGE